jgi:hypothetical protein
MMTFAYSSIYFLSFDEMKELQHWLHLLMYFLIIHIILQYKWNLCIRYKVYVK